MEAAILRSRHHGYHMAAFTVLDVKKDPLEFLDRYEPEVDEEIELFDPRCVLSELQLIVAFMTAANSFILKTAKAKKLSVEFLLRLAATTQISEAIRKVGISKSTRHVGVVIISKSTIDHGLCIKMALERLSGRLAPVTALGDGEFVREVYGLSSRFCSGKLLLDVLQKIATVGTIQ